ncbi:MgtC/SapB family protein [bacterium]|nr:MgtC/SapB family protein [bacterium]
MNEQLQDMQFLPAFLVAALCGAALGLERELQNKPAGLRTNMLIAIGSALFTHASVTVGGDPGRIAAQIVTGIGFLGAGTIIRDRMESIHGLTSAATVWVVAALGILAGAQHYLLAIVGTLLALGILYVMGLVEMQLVGNRIKHRFRIHATNVEWMVQRIQEQFLFERAELFETKIRPEPQDRICFEVAFRGSIRKADRLRQKISRLEGVTGVDTRVL